MCLALLWQNHEHHSKSQLWFKTVKSFSTCPVAQLGFVRVSSHPQLGYCSSPAQALAVLRRLLADPRHEFVPDDLTCEQPLGSESLAGPNAVTDSYLVSLAQLHQIKLASYDEALAKKFPGDVELLP